MAVEKQGINVPKHTLENQIPIDPEKSLVPILFVGDRVLIDPVFSEDDKYLSKETNIAKPVNMQEKFMKGRVMSIGGGEYGQNLPTKLKVGLLVNYWHQQHIPFTLDKKEYHLVRASDCFAIL